MGKESSPFVRRPKLYPEGFNANVELPYGLTVDEVKQALEGVYDFLHDLNGFLVSRGYERLEEIILGNSLSGFISELVVKRLGGSSQEIGRASCRDRVCKYV